MLPLDLCLWIIVTHIGFINQVYLTISYDSFNTSFRYISTFCNICTLNPVKSHDAIMVACLPWVQEGIDLTHAKDKPKTRNLEYVASLLRTRLGTKTKDWSTRSQSNVRGGLVADFNVWTSEEQKLDYACLVYSRFQIYITWYQVRNITVVVHSFDVFYLLILPFD